MNPNLTTVAAWSYGLAGIAYAAFALYLALAGAADCAVARSRWQ